MRSIVLLLLLTSAAHAQQRHEQHHVSYQGWINQKGDGCCNNDDCGELDAANEREDAKGVEVRLEGEWCRVEAEHYLKKGNAPNWQTSHVCVRKPNEWDGKSACERLLCYQPKPKV